MTANANVRTDQRHTSGRRCPICGGADRDPRGKGRRCHGFVSADGDYAHCSREEHAGAIMKSTDASTWAHRLTGSCKCGTTHGTSSDWSGIECAYDYRDESGAVRYQVVRLIPKSFRQRAPNGDGTWNWKTGGLRRVLYRLVELLATPRTETVYIVEGEKDVDTLRSKGLAATCNAMGAGKWGTVAEHAALVLRGRHVAIIADADETGREHAKQVAAALRGHVSTLRSFELPKKDASDWFDAGGTVDELKQIVEGVECESFDVAEPTAEGEQPFSFHIAKALEEVTAAIGTQSDTNRAPLFSTDATDLLREAFPPTPWQIDGLVTRGGTTAAAGEPKAAIKTWMAIEGAVAVATGTRMFGEFYAHKGRAAIFFAEDERQSVRNRVRALLAGADRTLQPGQLFLESRGAFVDVLKNDDLAWLIASCRQLGDLDLVVLDPLRDIHSGEEDKSDSMRDVMRRLRVLGSLLKCTVWITHHTPKANKDTAKRRVGQNLRGSSAIHGSIDSGLYIEPGDGDGTNVFKAAVTSQVKSGRSAGTFDLELRIVDDADGAAVSAAWTFARADFKRGSSPDGDKDADVHMLRLIEQLETEGRYLTQTEIRDMHPCPVPVGQKARVKSLRRLLDAGEIRTEAGRFRATRLPGAKGNAND